MTRFTGTKLDVVTIRRAEAAELVSQGYCHLHIGTWDDGTPAFVRIEIEPIEIGVSQGKLYSRPSLETKRRPNPNQIMEAKTNTKSGA